MEVIATYIKKFKVTKAQIMKRAKQVIYVRSEKIYEINLNHVMKNFSDSNQVLR